MVEKVQKRDKKKFKKKIDLSCQISSARGLYVCEAMRTVK
jgi:hypothetical protein